MNDEGRPPTTATPFQSDDYERLRQHLERAVRRICPTWLADRREDLVQVAMLRLFEISGRGEQKREYTSSYLWRVAYSALIDEIRRRRRRQEVGLEDGPGEDVVADVGPGPERRFEGQEISRALRECLGGLVEDRRLAVTLHLQGFKVAQSVPLLGWDAKRIYNLVHRGLKDLRECLTAKGLEP